MWVSPSIQWFIFTFHSCSVENTRSLRKIEFLPKISTSGTNHIVFLPLLIDILILILIFRWNEMVCTQAFMLRRLLVSIIPVPSYAMFTMTTFGTLWTRKCCRLGLEFLINVLVTPKWINFAHFYNILLQFLMMYLLYTWLNFWFIESSTLLHCILF